MTNAVKTEMQLHNTGGMRGRCLERTYKLSDVSICNFSVHSAQQVFCALTCTPGSLTIPLMLFVFGIRTSVRTATNVDSSLSVFLTALAMSLSSLRLLKPLPTSQPRPTQPSIPPGSVNEYQLRLGRQRQVRFIPLADERGMCR